MGRKKHGRWGKYLSSVKNNAGQNRSEKGQGKRFAESNLDAEHLEEIWQNQNGRCAVTGVPIELRYQGHEVRNRLLSASIDRIDNSIEYFKGNVQFVALGVNYAKNEFSVEETIEFFKAVLANLEAYQKSKLQASIKPQFKPKKSDFIDRLFS